MKNYGITKFSKLTEWKKRESLFTFLFMSSCFHVFLLKNDDFNSA